MKKLWMIRILTLIFAVALAVFWFVDPVLSTDQTVQLLWRSLISRALGSAAFAAVLLYLQYPVWQKPKCRHLAVLLPALAVVVNNLPILALCTGTAHVDQTGLIPLFALDSLMIGIFEELAFRGVLFPVMLESRCKSRRSIIFTAVASSAVFGLIHLVNLAEGAGVGATLLQVGYSFLIGGMCTVVLLKTGNLLWCMLLHAIYDFCGGLLPTLGSGAWWDIPTVVFTAVLGVAVAVWMLIQLLRIDPREIFCYHKQPINEKKETEEMNTIKITHPDTLMVAHRGLSGLEKENTMTSFVAAGNRSYWGVETDVHRTADGKFIVIHDDTTARVAGVSYPVEETDFETLRSLELLDIDKQPGRADLRMPTLKEYINVCKKYDKTCVLELKNAFSEEDICKILEEIREEDYLSRVVFISFCTENLIIVKRHCPQNVIQQLFHTIDEENFALLKEHRFDLDVDYRNLTEEWVKRIHAEGLKVNCWTVNSEEEGNKLASWGVDYITSNILE